MGPIIGRTTLLLLFGLWWGGLTFYSAIVVPISAERIGATEQGFVTRDVALWLNSLGTLFALALAAAAWRRRRREALACAMLLAALLVFLAVLHARLDAMLDDQTSSLAVESAVFYRWHRVYLVGTTVQWCLGLWAAVELVGVQFAPRELGSSVVDRSCKT